MFQIIRTGIDASNRDLAIISNNIANAGTNGFKRSEAQFEDVYRSQHNDSTEKARGISREARTSFKEYADEYKKLRECQFMCHSIQYKEGIFLDPHTNMAIPDQKDDDGNIIKEEDMIASHHYFVSIDASKRTDKNFQKLFLN